MAYAQIIEFDVDLDTHIRIGEAVGDEPIQGLIVHAGGASDRGVYSLDVWESKDAADRFLSERLIPAVEAMGLADGPPLSVQDYELPYVVRGSTGERAPH